jgi:hypothetical protein
MAKRLRKIIKFAFHSLQSLCLFESGYKLFMEWLTATTLVSIMTSYYFNYLETEEDDWR